MKTRHIILYIGFFLAFGLTSCGDQVQPATELEIAVPDPGKRFFEGGDGEFFGEDSPIVTINPALGYRPDLQLNDDVYWLPDAIAERKKFVDATTVEIELEDPTDPALGYEVDMVLINKYWPIRHRIVQIKRTDTRLTWTVVEAAYDEVIQHGDIYTYVPSDIPTPVGFDVLDPWLYDSREAQMQDIFTNYLDSELITMMATPESVAQMKEKKREYDALIDAQNDTLTRRQAMFTRPAWCDDINDRNLECEDLFEVGAVDFDACVDRKQPCEEMYPDDPDGTLVAECEAAKARGDFDLADLLVCDAYVRNNLDELSANGEPSQSPATWTHNHCVTNDQTIACSEQVYNERGTCVTNSFFDPKINVCPLFVPNPDVEESVKFLCDELCNFADQNKSGDGGASASDWSAGIGVCINSKVFGDDKCRARTALKLDFELVIDTASDDADDDATQDPDESNNMNGEFEFHVKITLAPVFTVAVGFKADMKIRPFWVGVKVGFFAGIGIGAQTTVEIGEEGLRWVKHVDLLELAKVEPEIPLPPILFLTFFLRPVAEADFFAEASVTGKITHNYFQERGFVICFSVRAGSDPFDTGKSDWPKTGVYSGQRAADKCGMDLFPETEPLNEIVNDDLGFEVRAGLELGVGIELVLKISGAVELGSLYYYPLVARLSIGATIRPPRCTFDIIVSFGWRFGGSLQIRISKFSIPIASFNESDTYPVPRYYKTFPITFIPGCGEIDAPEPAEYEGNECPPGPDPDDPDSNCLELPKYQDKDARCFVERCVEQQEMRVSLAWNDPRQDLDLYVRDPDGIVYDKSVFETTSCGATCGGSCSGDGDCLNGWICEGGSCQPEDPTYIENFVGSIGKEGMWEAWVVRRAEGDALNEQVLFDLEFENANTAPTRKATRGTIEPSDDGAPVQFLFCIGENCQ